MQEWRDDRILWEAGEERVRFQTQLGSMSKGPGAGAGSGRDIILMSGEGRQMRQRRRRPHLFLSLLTGFGLYPAGAAGPGSGRLHICSKLGK